MLFQKETHLCGGGRILQQEGVLDNLIQVEELDRFQGPPYLFPTSGQVRPLSSTPERLWKMTPNISSPFARRGCGTVTPLIS